MEDEQKQLKKVEAILSELVKGSTKQTVLLQCGNQTVVNKLHSEKPQETFTEDYARVQRLIKKFEGGVKLDFLQGIDGVLLMGECAKTPPPSAELVTPLPKITASKVSLTSALHAAHQKSTGGKDAPPPDVTSPVNEPEVKKSSTTLNESAPVEDAKSANKKGSGETAKSEESMYEPLMVGSNVDVDKNNYFEI